MRLVIDARESGTSTGRYIDKLVEYLHQLKPSFEVLVLTKSSRQEYMRQIAPNFKTIESNYKEFSFGEQLGFVRQLYKLKPDLVHFGMTQQPLLYFGRAVTTVHDLTTVRFNNPAKNRLVFKIKQLVYRLVIFIIARKSKHIITPSRYVKRDLAEFARVDPDKINVTYEAADKTTAEPVPMDEFKNKKFLLYVGRPNPHKNLDRLIEAMAEVKKSHPQIILVLAGQSDANYKKLEKLANKKCLTSQVFFTGFVSEGQLRWLYQNALAYVFPSLSEGFGLPGLEAMAHSLPVISSNATCLPEIYKDAAIYFKPRDISDIADKIIELAGNPALRAELAAKGQRLAASYSWERMAKQTLEIYERAIQG